MDLKETVAKIIQDELGDWLDQIKFTRPYEGEEFNVSITLHDEPDDFETRNTCMRYRVWQLGHDIGIFVDYPEETITV